MAQDVAEQELIGAAADEHVALRKVEQFIEHVTDSERARPQLVGPDGETVEVPLSVLRLLHTLVHHLAQGQAVTLVPIDKVLTTQQAAALLNVSRPYLVKLLDQGQIPYTRTGTHRRIQYSDLMEYKTQHDTQREKGLIRLAQPRQAIGLYDS